MQPVELVVIPANHSRHAIGVEARLAVDVDDGVYSLDVTVTQLDPCQTHLTADELAALRILVTGSHRRGAAAARQLLRAALDRLEAARAG